MSESSDAAVSEPIPISQIGGRYLLFDINVVTYLRRTHHICGVLVGSIPQIPQQNVFLGLPLELMPEEAAVLVAKGAAYVVDDAAWHRERFTTLQDADKKRYLGSLRSTGLEARRIAEGASKKRSENALAKHAAHRRRKEASSSREHGSSDAPDDDASESLFNDTRPVSRASSTTSLASDKPYAVTPTTTSPPPPPQTPPEAVPVPPSYPLFQHLHSRDYFVMPGLRFGCDYNVYPGDPLRFHSHFSATSYGWDEEFSMIDVIGGGRLGTRVKKGFLMGGEGSKVRDEGGSVRTFCIEWGGM